ncbi:MAG: polyprenol monophosphomannose synthase [Nitrososphaerales archaeon]
MVKARISVILPTYNERANLPVIIKQIRQLPIEVECVVVDDNSPDGTGELAERLASTDPLIKVVHRPKKLGLASAVLDGLQKASAPYVAVMDADLQHPPNLLPSMVNLLDSGADLVVASRYVRGGGVAGWSIFRYFISRCATILAHLLIPRSRVVKDPMSGYFALKRSVLEGLHLDSNMGYKILLSILAKAKLTVVKEVPMIFRRRLRGESKLGQKEILNYLRLLKDLLGKG